MKTNSKIAIALCAGAALGAVGARVLHAQAKPPAYVVSELDISDQERFIKEFVPVAGKLLMGGGGKALSRGNKTVSIYGDPPKGRIVIWQFETVEKALAVYNSPEYIEAKKNIGDKYAKFRTFIAEGVSPQ